MKKSAGAMNEAFKEQTETVNKVGFTWAQLKAEIEVTAERLGDALAPVFKAGLDFIRPFIGAVEQLIAIFSKLPIWVIVFVLKTWFFNSKFYL